jgi:uncharacterized protein YjbI with pentapeptide repeats
MSEQDGTQSTTKQRRSRKTNTAHQQNGKQAPAAQRPDNDDKEIWKAYWKTKGQPWRTEPEIDAERQKYLAERRSINPSMKQGIYPFKDIQLSRTDLEWLLSTHEDGRGLIEWHDMQQRSREGLDLRGADLQGENLSGLPLAGMQGGLSQGTDWNDATDEQRETAAVHLEGANLRRANLEGAVLNKARLEGADLRAAHLEGATLNYTHLEGKAMPIVLPPANLREVFFDSTTHIEMPTMGNKQSGFISVADVRWGGTNLAVIDWALIHMLGDEGKAHQQHRLRDYFTAVRANRQLSIALQDQGLNEVADRFAYRAQLLQREVWRRQRKPLKYLLSWFLFLLAGYGYRPERTIVTYLLIIVGFAAAYHFFGGLSLYPPDAFIYSLTSFHGRGFFPGLQNNRSLHDPLVMLAALEAVIGLLIEASFIATFTQRFFGK